MRKRGTADCATGGAEAVEPADGGAKVEKVFALYREKYFDFNVRHFHEKLRMSTGSSKVTRG